MGTYFQYTNMMQELKFKCVPTFLKIKITLIRATVLFSYHVSRYLPGFEADLQVASIAYDQGILISLRPLLWFLQVQISIMKRHTIYKIEIILETICFEGLCCLTTQLLEW